MPLARLAESTQTLYAELLEQAIHAEAETAALGLPLGSFVSKEIKGGTYWYLQRSEGGRKRQEYLGPESPTLLSWMAEMREARERTRMDEGGRARLCSMLAAGGAAVEKPAVAKVLAILAEAGVFRLGGVLVGTQALSVYGNVLGVRFEQQALRTEDSDVAQERAIGIALAEETAAADVAHALTDSKMGFFPVPDLDPGRPSPSFKIRGRELRVDFLTPLHGPDSTEPRFLPSLGVSAFPLRFLDYLLERPVQAVVVAGVLVNVPDPARFAFHKLWLASRRPVAEQTKAHKDRRQAAGMLEVLLEDRPGDLKPAWEALELRPSAAEIVRIETAKLPDGLRRRLKNGPGKEKTPRRFEGRQSDFLEFSPTTRKIVRLC